MLDEATERQILRRRLLGWGAVCREIMPGLDLGRDLRLVTGPNGLDLARVEAMDNLTQDLSIALTTRLGDDLFNIHFGFDGLNAMVEETNPVMVRERIRIAVIRVLNKDARVRRILDVAVGDDRLQASQAGSRQLDVRVAFETVSGDTLTIDFSKVVSNV